MVIVPNCGVFTKRFGVPKFTLFNALNASARNWKLVLSLTRKGQGILKLLAKLGDENFHGKPIPPKYLDEALAEIG